MAAIGCQLDLPAGFRAADIIGFHRRDAQELAERTAADRLAKGLLWGGRPACLSIVFTAGQAHAELAVDDSPAAADEAALAAVVRRMLGLDQPVEVFERSAAGHPLLAPLLLRQAGLRVPVTATPFEALTWAITGQQISVGAAVALRRRLILLAGEPHSAGLCCYPDATRLARRSEAELRAAGFSATKAQTLLTVGQQVAAGELPLDDWLAAPPVELLRERLLAIRGIGPWTVDYTLLRGFGWLDGSLHGDAAVRRGLQLLSGATAAPDEKATRAWLAPFAPWRALLAAHLWAMQAVKA